MAAIKNVVEVITEIDHIGVAIASAIEEQGSATKEIARNIQQTALGTQDVASNISGVQQSRRAAALSLIYDPYTLGMNSLVLRPRKFPARCEDH